MQRDNSPLVIIWLAILCLGALLAMETILTQSDQIQALQANHETNQPAKAKMLGGAE